MKILLTLALLAAALTLSACDSMGLHAPASSEGVCTMPQW